MDGNFTPARLKEEEIYMPTPKYTISGNDSSWMSKFWDRQISEISIRAQENKKQSRMTRKCTKLEIPIRPFGQNIDSSSEEDTT